MIVIIIHWLFHIVQLTALPRNLSLAQLKIIPSHSVTSYMGEETNIHFTATLFQRAVEHDSTP